MVAEEEEFTQLDDVGVALAIFLTDEGQNFDLYLGLLYDIFASADYLEGHSLLGLMVYHTQHLSKRATPELSSDLVAIGDMLILDKLVVPLLIIESLILSAFALGFFV